jgi:hypothetical protein
VPDGTCIEHDALMRITIVLAAAALLAACRGERVPRDYQNTPPAVTHPVTSSQQTPTAHGLPGPAPEPSSGVEGKALPREPKLKDQAPVTDTQHQTQTGGTTVTGTHLRARP